ncbi:MAG: GDP-mannose 4,6-dehydratase [Candidatus Omnitrophota bacterium]
MNILITGGAGFVGSHLARVLLRQKPRSHIYIIDDLSTWRISNIEDIINDKRIHFLWVLLRMRCYQGMS